jgi:hypothetical protein
MHTTWQSGETICLLGFDPTRNLCNCIYQPRDAQRETDPPVLNRTLDLFEGGDQYQHDVYL